VEFRSVFDLWSFGEQVRLRSALQALAPYDAYRLMLELRDAEVQAYESAVMREVFEKVRPKLDLAPELSMYHDLDEVAWQHARYFLIRFLDAAYLSLYIHDSAKVAQLISFRGLERLHAAREARGGVVLLPLHLGPCEVSIPLLAGLLPLSTVVADRFPSFDELLPADLDLEVLRVPDVTVLVRCLRALSKGRTLAIFPEFSGGVDQPEYVVPFLGARLRVPSGYAAIAQRKALPMVPYTFREDGQGRFEFDFLEPISVADGEEGLVAALADVFGAIEHAVVADRPGEWELWSNFDLLLA
jgi:lauroyl/myristoyl acyltransferase